MAAQTSHVFRTAARKLEINRQALIAIAKEVMDAKEAAGNSSACVLQQTVVDNNWSKKGHIPNYSFKVDMDTGYVLGLGGEAIILIAYVLEPRSAGTAPPSSCSRGQLVAAKMSHEGYLYWLYCNGLLSEDSLRSALPNLMALIALAELSTAREAFIMNQLQKQHQDKPQQQSETRNPGFPPLSGLLHSKTACHTTSHSHVLRCYGTGSVRPLPSIAPLRELGHEDIIVASFLELAHGSLADVIGAVKSLSSPSDDEDLQQLLAHCFQGAANALHCCSISGVLHRDFKADNLLLVLPDAEEAGAEDEEPPIAKLCDFGISVLSSPGASPGASHSYTCDHISGTPALLDPAEVLEHKLLLDDLSTARPEVQLTSANDLYSFGVTVAAAQQRSKDAFALLMKDGAFQSAISSAMQQGADDFDAVVSLLEVQPEWVRGILLTRLPASSSTSSSCHPASPSMPNSPSAASASSTPCTSCTPSTCSTYRTLFTDSMPSTPSTDTPRQAAGSANCVAYQEGLQVEGENPSSMAGVLSDIVHQTTSLQPEERGSAHAIAARLRSSISRGFASAWADAVRNARVSISEREVVQAVERMLVDGAGARAGVLYARQKVAAAAVAAMAAAAPVGIDPCIDSADSADAEPVSEPQVASGAATASEAEVKVLVGSSSSSCQSGLQAADSHGQQQEVQLVVASCSQEDVLNGEPQQAAADDMPVQCMPALSTDPACSADAVSARDVGSSCCSSMPWGAEDSASGTAVDAASASCLAAAAVTPAAAMPSLLVLPSIPEDMPQLLDAQPWTPKAPTCSNAMQPACTDEPAPFHAIVHMLTAEGVLPLPWSLQLSSRHAQASERGMRPGSMRRDVSGGDSSSCGSAAASVTSSGGGGCGSAQPEAVAYDGSSSSGSSSSASDCRSSAGSRLSAGRLSSRSSWGTAASTSSLLALTSMHVPSRRSLDQVSWEDRVEVQPQDLGSTADAWACSAKMKRAPPPCYGSAAADGDMQTCQMDDPLGDGASAPAHSDSQVQVQMALSQQQRSATGLTDGAAVCTPAHSRAGCMREESGSRCSSSSQVAVPGQAKVEGRGGLLRRLFACMLPACDPEARDP